MRPQSAKSKGRRFQQRVRDILTNWFGWEPGDCESRPMGSQGVDLMLSPRARMDFPWACELKNQERLNPWLAYLQATANGVMTGRRPLVIFARNRSQPMVLLSLEDFLTWGTTNGAAAVGTSSGPLPTAVPATRRGKGRSGGSAGMPLFTSPTEGQST